MQGSIQQQNALSGRHVRDDMSPLNSSDSSFHYLNINDIHDEWMREVSNE